MTSSAQNPAPSDDTSALIDGLAHSAFLTMGALTRIAADHDLSLTQLRVLAILRDRRLRMTDLADYLGLEKSTLSGLVSRAEARGLVGRAPDPSDKRAVEVFLTDDGLHLGARVTAEMTDQLAPLVSALRPAERRSLHELLAKALDATVPMKA
ncbi:MarR family winged helix-turn-helix transcriptional regulator [Herbiconiux ginsengi]|uniref:DNA-binding transcriptional regulator, MarR family n=1 Tax=Herbiconiux ginsengi TaxID=381665 RepID=A0A1H3Q9Q8_9MICO|nr:MarR family transcriptional regulator [Herbiconiux ginsengi]SDZ10107.1 DNA-binding transcriptional regulator, MarR family [Herbiconiux ginsengi]